MAESGASDLLVGDEVVRVSLEPCEVWVVFNGETLQIGAPFALMTGGTLLSRLDPSRRAGDPSVLWRLVGNTVRAVMWPDDPSGEIRVVFGDDTELVIPPSRHPRGSFVRGLDERDRFLVDDF